MMFMRKLYFTVPAIAIAGFLTFMASADSAHAQGIYGNCGCGYGAPYAYPTSLTYPPITPYTYPTIYPSVYPSVYPYDIYPYISSPIIYSDVIRFPRHFRHGGSFGDRGFRGHGFNRGGHWGGSSWGGGHRGGGRGGR
jgi:uncharacterized membrane protein YgcG